MSQLTSFTLAECRDGLRKGDFSSVELTQAYIDAIRDAHVLNAFTIVTEDKALHMAAEADRIFACKNSNAPDMCGIPLGIKDLFCTKGIATQACSKMLDGFVAPYESTVTNKLWDQGAVMLGKLNMDEFAMGASNTTSCNGNVISPWRSDTYNDEPLNPGGSSGGSSAAVSARLCVAATGSDTGGSIRTPAAFTGIVGIKPTYGRCSRYGMIAFASSLDQAGVLARDVHDASIMLRAISGHDPLDSTSADIAVPDYESTLHNGIQNKTIGIPMECMDEDMDDEVRNLWLQAIEWLKDAGAKISHVSLANFRYSLPVYYVIAMAEASSNLARYDGVRYGYRAPHKKGESIHEWYARSRSAGFGQEVKRRILIGTYVLSSGFYDAYYMRAQKIRKLIQADFKSVFDSGVDAMLVPTALHEALPLKKLLNQDAIKNYRNDVFTVSTNLAGLPAISVPSGMSSNSLPLGLQLIGQPWKEQELLNCAAILEKCANITSCPSAWWKKSL